MFDWWHLGHLHCHLGWTGTRWFAGRSSVGSPLVVECESLPDHCYREEELRETTSTTAVNAAQLVCVCVWGGSCDVSSNTSGYTILSPLQVSCQTIRLPASSTQPKREESMCANARSVTAPVKPFSRERSAKQTLRIRIMAWLFAPGEKYQGMKKTGEAPLMGRWSRNAASDRMKLNICV